MTGTSSARPSRLQAYPGALRAMDDELDSLAGTLDDRLTSFKEGAEEFAPGFDPEATGKWVRDLAAMEDGFEQTGDAMEASHAGFVNGLKGGGALVTGLGLAAIPATGGASLLVTAAGALSGPLLDTGIDTAAGDADEAPLSPGELQRAVARPLRESLARLIAERDGIPLPPPEDRGDLLSGTSPHGDPVNFLDVNSTVSGVQYEEDEHW